MEINKKQYRINGRYAFYVRVILSEHEEKMVALGNLGSCQIQTRQSFLTSPTFKLQLNRVRNRWSVAVKRSTGYIFLDTIGRGFGNAFRALYNFFRFFFGTRSRFSDLMRGAEFTASSLEGLREMEVFVFASIAAIHNAIDFTSMSGEVVTYTGRQYVSEIAGLSFAGGAIVGNAGALTNTARMLSQNDGDYVDVQDIGDEDDIFDNDDLDVDGDLDIIIDV